jgi:hypothetical protein
MEASFGNSCDWQNLRYVGWDSSNQNQGIEYLFCPTTIRMISEKITELLEGVDKNGKSIKVTDNVICNVLSSIVANEKNPGNIGDIHSRYTIPRNNPGYATTTIIDRTIEVIVSHIKNEEGMIQTNESLSIWNSILGGQNKLGLMPHSKIKLQERHPQHMAFNMNY